MPILRPGRAPRPAPPRTSTAREALRDLPLDGAGAVYGQIYRALRDAVMAGRTPPGARLPATRWLADDLGVSRNTVLAAYDQLLAEGYAVARVGAGTFVAPQLPSEAAGGGVTQPTPVASDAPPPRLSSYGEHLRDVDPRKAYDADAVRSLVRFDFRPCVPDLESLPDDEWRRCAARRASLAPAGAFDYPDPSGLPALREEIAGHLARQRGVGCAPEQIVVVNGVAQALDLAARLFLDPGDRVLVEDPHYLGARRAFEAAGAELVPGRVDAEGLRIDGVDPEQLARCRLAYVTPSHQFPTGVVLSLTRRLAILEWAERNDAFVLEDDYDSEFRYAGRAIEALKSLDAGGRVVYVGTFSKTLFPALRIAYLVLPVSLVDVFRSAKWLSDWSSPLLEQQALAEFMRTRGFDRHLRRARTLYGRRRSVMLEALAQDLAGRVVVHDSRMGLHVLARLPGVPAAACTALAREALEREVRIYDAAPCRLERVEHAEIVLGFTRLDEEAIREGVARLARAVRVIERERGRQR